MGTVNHNISRFEITSVYSHADATADIILVHGLNGHPWKTWATKNCSFWPTELLPASLLDCHANVLVYGYNADVYEKSSSSSPSDNFIFQHAQTLVTTLTLFRKSKKTVKNPIIWVAHSLGGVLVKRALLYSNDIRAVDHEDYRSVYVSTYGIIFLGTPHTGSGLAAWGRILQAMCDVVIPRPFFRSESILLKTLKKDNERLQEINSHFLDIHQRFKIHMVHENHKSNLGYTRALVVDAASASPQLPGVTYYGIEAAHAAMCKFESTNAPGYQVISSTIRNWVGEASQVINGRWDVEEMDRHARARLEITERRLPFSSVTSVYSQPNDLLREPHSTLPVHISQHCLPASTLGGKSNDHNLPGSHHLSLHGRKEAPSGLIQKGDWEGDRDRDTYMPSLTPHPANRDTEGIPKSLHTIDKSICAFTAQHQSTMLSLRFFGIPYPRNRYFTGRETVLSDIRDLLLSGIRVGHASENPSINLQLSPSVFVLHGLPGIGKTHLAIEFGYRQKDTFTHVFWIASDSEEKFDQGFLNIARSIGLTQKSITEDREKIVYAAMTWLKTASPDSKWLLILDNLDDARILNPLWSNLGRGSVLITSREPIPGITAVTHSSRNCRLVQLSPSEGQELIKKRLRGQIYSAIDDDAAADLAKRFAYYPLYIDQMTSLMESAPLTLAEFYGQLGSEQADHELQDFAMSSPWYSISVAKAIESHIAKLHSFNAQAADILTTLAFFDPDSIPERLLLSAIGLVPCVSSVLRWKKILFTLSRSSFVYRDPDGPSEKEHIHMHRLVRDAALRSAPTLQSAFETAVQLLRRSFPLHKMSRDHMVEDWAVCEVFQPHVLSLHSQYVAFRNGGAIAPSFDFIELIYSCAWYLCERGRFSLSKTLISTISNDYDSLRKANIAVPPEFLADIYTVQLYYHNESDHGISLVELAKQAMNVREEAVKNGLMDENHPNRANGFMNVGVVLALDNPMAAIKMHSKALEIRLGSEKYRSEQIHGLALNYVNLGRCWWVVGELEKASSCFEQGLALWKERETTVGKRFSMSAWALLALGIVRADQNDLESATNFMSESLELHIVTMGERHKKTLACLYRLGWLCLRIGEYRRASQLLTICLETYSSLPDPPKPELARTMFQLSQADEKTGFTNERALELAHKSRLLLSEILSSKGAMHIQKEDFDEVDFDNEVDYYFR